MQRRSTEEILAGVLGIIGSIFSIPLVFMLIAGAYYAVLEILDGDLDYYDFVSTFGAMVSGLVLASAITGLGYLRKRKLLLSSYAFASAVVCWFLYSTAFVIAEMIEGYSDFFETIWEIYFWRGEIYIFPSGAPSPLVFGVAAVLLYMRAKQGPAPIRFQPHGANLSAMRDVQPNGSKKCPDCAEFVKVEAMKCRFCGYRFGNPQV